MICLLEGISKQGMRVVNFLIRGARLGMSGRQLLLFLRQHGLGYRTETFYRDYKLVRGAIRPWERMKYIPRNKFIPEHWYTPTKSPLATNYQTTFELRVFDFNIYQERTIHVTVGHDRLYTRGHLERIACSIAQGTSPKIDVLDIKPTRAFKSPVRWV